MGHVFVCDSYEPHVEWCLFLVYGHLLAEKLFVLVSQFECDEMIFMF